MLGILLAATVVAAPAPPAAAHPLPDRLLAARQFAERLACPATRQLKTVGPGGAGPQKLGDLPDAEAYHAVWKTAGGCPIDEVYQNGRWVDRWSGTKGPGLRHAGGDDR